MLFSLLLLPMFIFAVSTTPVPDAGFTISIPLTRRSLRQKSAIHSGNMEVFDPAPAKEELRGLIFKYAEAAAALARAGLNHHDITSYLPLKNISHTHSPNASTAEEEQSEQPLIPSIIVTTGTATMPLQDLMSGALDVLYYGPLEFGTPPQRLTVDVDTGSADLWIPVSCPDCENRTFDSGASSTYTDSGDDFSVSYGSGDVSGTLAMDVVSVEGLTVEKQVFGAVTRESDDFNGYPSDGLLGMAFGSIAQSKQPTFFEKLIEGKKLAAPLFSVHLTRNRAEGSEVCFGCYDQTKTTGTVSWVPVKSQTYWSIVMDAIMIDASASVQTNIIAAIDTGTTLIYVPDDVAARFYELIPGAGPAPQYGPEFYTFPCASKLDVALLFGGKAFSLNISDFNMGRANVDSSDCVGGILSLGNGFPSNLAIVGDEFLKSWYSTYDYSNGARIGFSPSINNKS